MTNAIVQGTPVPDDILGPLRDSSDVVDDGNALRERLDHDDYLFLRGVVDRNAILAARDEVFARLMEVDEITAPASEGIATGTSRRKELVDLGEFWQSVSEGPRLRHVSHGTQVADVMSRVFDEPSRPHDYMFLRPGVVGRSTHLHFDLPFFSRGSQRIHTVWLALNEIPLDLGPLAVVEGSHRFDDLIEPVRQVDYESSNTPYVQMLDDTVEFARERGSRLLTAAFAPGDIVIFTMTLMHGTLDNHSSENRVRLSCDVRWQPAADDLDPRYTAPNPPGTTGAGYAELNGAKPLTEDWHKR
jgi:ectoine hydroxylase-related dioxygenase (phytanoyl-CoA dioxygenase family)